ncbi:hypothetical protein [Streptomyces sp. HUAS TT20]|uniref:hypothetical protein n=1 Tax=Streptomyces sp. HUAS TT20 TaxID=3447509 RepID=UPI0021D8894C|nr:hypothetical protein [Streptomyces sp. HUAS 15-9]UXY31577.1 hypothetical protein N8I87_36915 [Streptomyces sp. HUAS 15-9]
MTKHTMHVPAALLLAGAALATAATPVLAAGSGAGAPDQPVAKLIGQVSGPLVECAVDRGLQHCRPMSLNP